MRTKKVRAFHKECSLCLRRHKMREALKLVTVRSKYCEFLREYDCRVSINSNEKVA